MNTRELRLTVEGLGACPPALRWLRRQPQNSPAWNTWKACKNPDWLMWLLAQANITEGAIKALKAEAHAILIRAGHGNATPETIKDLQFKEAEEPRRNREISQKEADKRHKVFDRLAYLVYARQAAWRFAIVCDMTNAIGAEETCRLIRKAVKWSDVRKVLEGRA